MAYPQWSRSNGSTASDGTIKIDGLHGDPDGRYWCPGEPDFPIRRNNAWNGGWLWKSGEDRFLFSVDELTDKYCKSVGRNTNILMGMVVDTSGLIPKADSLVFDRLGKRFGDLFGKPVAQFGNIQRSSKELIFRVPQMISRVVITEDIAKGENIRGYGLDAWIAGSWKEIASGQSIGHKRI